MFKPGIFDCWDVYGWVIASSGWIVWEIWIVWSLPVVLYGVGVVNCKSSSWIWINCDDWRIGVVVAETTT